MDAWCVKQMGFPVLIVKERRYAERDDGGEFVVEQEWFISDKSYGQESKDKESVWTIPIIINSNEFAAVAEGVREDQKAVHLLEPKLGEQIVPYPSEGLRQNQCGGAAGRGGTFGAGICADATFNSGRAWFKFN